MKQFFYYFINYFVLLSLTSSVTIDIVSRLDISEHAVDHDRESLGYRQYSTYSIYAPKAIVCSLLCRYATFRYTRILKLLARLT